MRATKRQQWIFLVILALFMAILVWVGRRVPEQPFRAREAGEEALEWTISGRVVAVGDQSLQIDQSVHLSSPVPPVTVRVSPRTVVLVRSEQGTRPGTLADIGVSKEVVVTPAKEGGVLEALYIDVFTDRDGEP